MCSVLRLPQWFQGWLVVNALVPLASELEAGEDWRSRNHFVQSSTCDIIHIAGGM